MTSRIRPPFVCQHHWLLGSPVNHFKSNTVTIHQRCKKCGEESDKTTEAVDTGSAVEGPVTKDVPSGFHLVSDEEQS